MLVCVCVCVRACVHACVRACVYALRIVSKDKILCLKNILIIIIIIIIIICQSVSHYQKESCPKWLGLGLDNVFYII